MAKWIVLRKGGDFVSIGKKLGISPVLARMIRNRGAIGEEQTRMYLEGSLGDLHDPYLLHGMDRAVELLGDRIDAGVKIRIIGDYDVDGVCSSYILWRMITFLGGHASVRLPDRIRDGYGLNETMVEEALRDGVETIITCDNGIAAGAALKKAKDAGMTVIVTDHHEIPYTREGNHDVYTPPEADVILEPKYPKTRVRPEDPKEEQLWYPFREICGAEVVYKLAQAMLGMPDLSGSRTEETELLRELLGFAAIATVCDVMPLVDENRILVREGLREASHTTNTGLRALLNATGLDGQSLTAYHAGFVIGPCINACGRMDTADRALALFMEEDEKTAADMAEDLKNLNETRKTLTEDGVTAAVDWVERQKKERSARGEQEDRVLLIYLPGTRESIAGIIAGKVREKYAHPTFVLTDAEGQEGELKGSGRSIDAYDMFTRMNEAKDLMDRFGGHRLAAGLSLKKENLEPLRKRLNDACDLPEDAFRNIIYVDMILSPKYVTMDIVRQLSLLEPCGQGNQKPLMIATGVSLTGATVLGKNRNVIRFSGSDRYGRGYCFILFSADERAKILFDENRTYDLVYYPAINEFRGSVTVQFVIKDYQVSRKQG